MKWTKKIKGGALQFVLFIGAIIAVLLLSFVLVTYSHILFKKKTDITIDLIQATESAFERTMASPFSQQEILESIDESGIQTNIQRRYWGLLELRTAIAKKGKLSFKKNGLVGHAQEDRAALYLKDNQRPMVIVGNARISGTAYLPQRGIKMGNIGGYGYTKTQLVYGKKLFSNSQLPPLEEAFQTQIAQLSNPFFEPQGIEAVLKKGVVLKNSFTNETQIIKGSIVRLEDLEFTGNILVWATKRIVVHPSAKLRDVVLVAPNIEVMDHVKGNFQAIASKHIQVGRKCQLEYPTVLAVNKRRGKEDMEEQSLQAEIHLENGTWVTGILLYLDENEANRTKPHIEIEENAKVMGEVYCTQNLELKGNVNGSVITNAFVAAEKGSIYLNHLYNGQIDASLLPSEYGGLYFGDEPKNTVMKWLY